MKTTGLFTTHVIDVPVKIGQTIKFIPFGDVHRDSDMHADEHWREFLSYAKAQPNAVFLGMGDYMDGMSTSERICLNVGGLHDTTKKTITKVYTKWAERMAEELSFMRGRTIGLLGGNHYMGLDDGTTTDHLLAHGLGCRFLGVCSLIRLRLKIGGNSGTNQANFDIFAHHGKGGGITAGGQFNTIEKMSKTAEADIYLMGHTHGKGCIPDSPRLRLVGSSKGVAIRERTPWLGRTGSFLKAYENERVSYNVDAARSGCALGWIEFDITPKRRRTNGDNCIEFQVRGTS